MRLFSFLITAITALSLQVSAQDKIDLQFYDREFGAHWAERIDLQQEIRYQYPFFANQLQWLKVRRVMLTAKSYSGQSYVNLRIADYDGDQRFIDGQPNNYYDSYPQTFYREDFFVQNHSNWGGWTLDVNGPVKIRSIVLIVDGNNNPPQPPNPPWGGGGNSFKMTCNSWGTYNRCPIPGANAVDVRLVQQISDAQHRCKFNDTWGWDAFQIWVDRGCRGIFEVVPRDNGWPQPQPFPPPWPPQEV